MVNGEEKGHLKGMADGEERGGYSARVKLVKKMLTQNMPLDLIALYTEFTEEEIENLKNSEESN